MTRQEAEYELQWIRAGIDEYSNLHVDPRLKKEISALDMAITALRPITREQVEKVWRGEWVLHKSDDVFSSYHTCSNCGCKYGESSGVYIFDLKFCPHCGVIMKAEAVDMVMERMEALYESIHNS